MNTAGADQNSNNNNARIQKPNVPSKPRFLKSSQGKQSSRLPATDLTTPRSWQRQNKFIFEQNTQENAITNQTRKESETKFSSTPSWRPVPRIVAKERSQTAVDKTEYKPWETAINTALKPSVFKPHSRSLCIDEDESGQGFGSLKRMWSQKGRNVNDSCDLQAKQIEQCMNKNFSLEVENNAVMSKSLSFDSQTNNSSDSFISPTSSAQQSLSRSASSSSNCSVHTASFKRKSTTWHYVTVGSPTTETSPTNAPHTRSSPSHRDKKFDFSLQTPRPYRSFSVDEDISPVQPTKSPSFSPPDSLERGAHRETVKTTENSGDMKSFKQNHHNASTGNAYTSMLGSRSPDMDYSDQKPLKVQEAIYSSNIDLDNNEQNRNARLQRMNAVAVEGVTVNDYNTDYLRLDSMGEGQTPPPLLPRDKVTRSSRSSVVPPVGVRGAREWNNKLSPTQRVFQNGQIVFPHREISPDSTVAPPLLPRGEPIAPVQDYTPMAGADMLTHEKRSLGSSNASLSSPPAHTDLTYEPMDPYDNDKSFSYSAAVEPSMQMSSVREYHEIDPDPEVPIGMTSPPILEPGAVPPPPNQLPPTLPAGAKTKSQLITAGPKPPSSPPPLPPLNTNEKKGVKKLNYVEVEIGAGDTSGAKAYPKSQHVKTNYTEVIVGGAVQKNNGSNDAKKGKSVKGKLLSMFSSKSHDGYSSDGDIISESTTKNNDERLADFAKERNKLKRLSGRLLRKKKSRSRDENSINSTRISADLNTSTFQSSSSREGSDIAVGIYGSATNLSTTSSGSSRSLSHITSTSNSATSSGDGQAVSLEKHQKIHEDTVNRDANKLAASRRQSYEPHLTNQSPRLSQKSRSEQQLNIDHIEMNLTKTHLRPQEAAHAYSRSAENTPMHGYQARRTGGDGKGSPVITAPRVQSHLHQKFSNPRPMSDPSVMGTPEKQGQGRLMRPASSPFDSDVSRPPMLPPHSGNSPAMVRLPPLPLLENLEQTKSDQGENNYQEPLSPNLPTESPPAPPSLESMPDRPLRFSQKAIKRPEKHDLAEAGKDNPPTPMRDLKPDRFRKSGRPMSDPNEEVEYCHAEDVPEIDEEARIRAENSGDPIYDVVPFDTEAPPSPSSKSKLLESEPLYQVYRSRTLSHASTKLRHSEANMRRRLKTTIVSANRLSDNWESDLMTEDAGAATLWKEVTEVVKNGVGKDLTNDQMKLQQAQFEVVTSQASYMRSLNILTNHFMRDWAMESTDILPRAKRKQLFSNIESVREVERRFLQDIEEHFWSSLYLTNIAKITSQYAKAEFEVYVRYVQNQVYQDRVLTELQRNNDKFSIELGRLESSPMCNKLPLLSFLLLPMQRVTRLPLLISAIVNQADSAGDKVAYNAAKQALAVVNKLVKKCNEGARKMQQTEQLAEIASELAFASKVKTYALVSQSRALVKKGEMQVTIAQENKKPKVSKLYLFLFTDVLLLARKKSFLEAGSNLKYEVVDWAKRAMLFINERAVAENEIFLVLLENCLGKRVEMTLMPVSQNELSRWTDALNPQKAEESGDSIYESWDCPQYECIYPYTAQQPDELTLDVHDVMRVIRKTTDGWLEGERLRDNEVGWFPAENCEEIEDEHVRARNLRNLYRIIPAGM